MRMLNKLKKFGLILSTLAILTFACSCGPAATAPPPASATAPVSLTAGPLAPDFTEIDQALKAALTGSIAYNAPQAMKLNETATIELLLNPSVEPGVLATQITQPGEVVTASVEITPRMKAVLLSQSQEAFFIQPLHDNAEQLSQRRNRSAHPKDKGKSWDKQITDRMNSTVLESGKWQIYECGISHLEANYQQERRNSHGCYWKER